MSLREVFGAALHGAAERLVESGRVMDVRVLQGGAVVTGVVMSEAPPSPSTNRHRVYIRRSGPKIEGECGCSERAPCAHVAAVLVAAERGSDAGQGSVAAPRSAGSQGATVAGSVQQQRLFYLLEGVRVSAWVGQVTPSTRAILSDTVRPFTVRSSLGAGDFPRYVEPGDKEILGALRATRTDGPWDLTGEGGSRLLVQIAATGRAFWKSWHGQALRAGEPRHASFAWHALPNGDQELRCEAETGTGTAAGAPVAAQASISVLLDLAPAMYVNPATAEVGRLESAHPLSLVRRYWQQTPVTPEQVIATRERIARDTAATPFPAPALLATHRHALKSLSARLMLSAGPNTALYFVYNDLPIAADRLRDAAASARQIMDGALYEIPRDLEREQQWRQQLQQHLPGPSQNREAWLGFMVETLPSLQAQGWDISVAADFPYRLAAADNWYGDLEKDRRQGWFNLRLGVVVDGKDVNLLPALTRYLQTSLAGGDQTSLASDTMASPDLPEGNAGCRIGDQWLVLLDDGRYLPIAIERIQRIANTLVELFDRDGLTAQQALSLPTSHTGRVAQLARELNGPTLRSNDAALRELLDDIKSSGGIQPLSAPAHFQATLRPYQEEGLGWLQFLRRHQLGGILADDMGLGKTVQTLAHLALEKYEGRLRKPSLIVAPVSTLGNWQQEAHRFAPELEVLLLHGSRRRESFARIGEADIVITGYSLLQMDSETLLSHDFYLIILDEAQMIKNPRAKVSGIARALRSDHRLALTGTPVENHLGELWSLFDFAQPGLLRDERHFQRHYRTPIEKDGNRMRAQALAQRLGPFLLRRTKDAVAKDLPPKTEIVEVLAFDERQRDFYDGVRLASHRRIQEVVQQQGLARSQITILDALLKLRQVCCDPRLLGVAAGKEDIPSAKLEWLSTVLPELIEEGRRVLVFSQFTSMLRLIEAAITALGIPYCLLTGETQNRPEVIARFQSGAVPVFLISLKAGGTGLNLTAADTVIHYDPWWNPAVEAQATDRAHRIGQDKPVFVYKLIAQDTVEERIMQLQADKHSLASRLYTESTGTPASLTATDIEALFAS